MGKTLHDLSGAHKGRPAVVIGGGPSAPEQLKSCPADALYISANQHGCFLRRCDYVYCADAVEERINLRESGVPIISPRPSADYQISEQRFSGSGAMAAYCAWLMGCAPILLVGMDCYQGGTYFHDASAESVGKRIPLHRHLARWAPLVALAGNNFRVFSGPLVGLFLLYEPGYTSCQSINLI